MRHTISPLVDVVFKAILGDPRHASVLVHFLNSILRPAALITQVEILNPYNDKEFETAKLTIVDIKAKDAQGRWYQIEVQLLLHPALPERMLYTWADIYRRQLDEAEHFERLQPLQSIWLVNRTLFPKSPPYHHRFMAHDAEQNLRLTDQLAIHVIELPKWQLPPELHEDEDRWLYFFQNAGQWDTLPATLHIPPLEKAMSVLRQFSEDDREYFRYQSRINALRVEGALMAEQARMTQQIQALSHVKEQLSQEKELLSQEKEQLSQEKELLSQEKEQLSQEKDQLSQEKDQLSQEKEQLSQEKELLSQEKELLSQEKDQLSTALERATAEQERLQKLLQALGVGRSG